MRREHLPSAAEEWLRRVRIASASLSRPHRRELLDGLRAHIADALDSGENLELTLLWLGDPEAVAREAEESLASPNSPRRTRWVWDTPRTLSVGALGLALLGFVVVAFWPAGELTATADGATVFTTRIGPISVVFWSVHFLLTTTLAIVGAVVGVAARKSRLQWTYAAAAVVVVAAAVGVVSGNVVLLPSAAAAVGAVLSLRVRRAQSSRRAAPNEA